jgi:hypothetical protein
MCKGAMAKYSAATASKKGTYQTETKEKFTGGMRPRSFGFP